MSLSGKLLVWCLGLAAATSVAANASPLAEDGWRKLLGNQNAPARIAFLQALKKQPADIEAHRGMAVLHSLADNPAGEASSLRELYRLRPDHWSARPYWPRFVHAVRRSGRWDLLEGAAVDIGANKKSPTELRTVARRALADKADRAGKWATADTMRARLGYVRQWQVIGPFGHESGSGHDKDYAPERSLSASTRHAGRDDVSTEWRRLRVVSRQGKCRVGESLGDFAAGTFYAATAIRVQKPGPAIVWFEPAGASKFWINGRLTYSDSLDRPERDLAPELYRSRLTLQPGWNTLLVKISAEVSRSAAFQLRVTQLSGEPLPGLVIDPAQAKHSVATPAAPPGGSRATVAPDCVEVLRKAGPQNRSEAAVCEARLLVAAGDTSGAVRVLRQAALASPQCGWVRGELAQTLAEDGQHDEARGERAAALRANPGQVEVALDHSRSELTSLEPAERIQRIRSLLQLNPNSISVHWELYAVYSAAGLRQEALQSLQKVRSTRPGPEEIYNLAEAYMEEERIADAAALVPPALKATPYQEELLSTQASILEYQEKVTAAISIYERLLALRGPDPITRASLARLHLENGNATRAIQILRLVRQERPQDTSICVQLADLLREKGAAGDAAEPLSLYREAVRLDPSLVYLRERIQVLGKEKPVFDLAPGLPMPSLQTQKSPPNADGGASAICLLNEQRTVVYPDFATTSRHHQVIQILDAGAAEELQEIGLTRSSSSSRVTVEKSRLIKANGKTQDMMAHADFGSVSFPSLAVGDIIDFSYRTEDFRKGALSRHFWADWEFTIPGIPVKTSRFVLITPPSPDLRTRTVGKVPDATLRDVDGWRVREWKLTDVPAYRIEPFGTPTRDQGMALDVSTVGSWSEIVRWYLDLSRTRCVADETVRQKTQELTREAQTDEDKLRAIVKFVAGLRYQTTPFRLSAFIPTEGKEVLREQFGDCKDKAALVTAMARSLGMKANMVLLSGRSDGISPLLPSPRFNHAIARVALGGRDIWIDATADDLEFGDLPTEDQQVPALVIDETTTDLVTTPATAVERNGTSERVEGTLDAAGKLTATLEFSGTGNWAWTLRSMLKLVPAANQADVYRGILARLYPTARSEGGSIENLQDHSKPVVVRVKFSIDRFATVAGNLVLLKLPWSNGQGSSLETLLGSPQRQQDAELGQTRGVYSSKVVLRLPPDYTLQPRAGKSGETRWGSYDTRFAVDGNILTAERRLRISPLRVPVRELPPFTAFLREEQTESQEPVILRKP